jgi:hypothetical protein
MLIKSTLIAAAAAIAFSGAAIADGAKGPSLMTNEALDTIVAGGTFMVSYCDIVSSECNLIDKALPVDDLASTVPVNSTSVDSSRFSGFEPVLHCWDNRCLNIGGGAVTFYNY